MIKRSILASIAAIIFGGASASANVQVTFSGGNGTPLLVSLSSPAQYTVTTAETAGSGLVFVFESPSAST